MGKDAKKPIKVKVRDPMPIGLVSELRMSPYERILNRYYGGLDIALAPSQVNRIDAYIVSYPKSGRTWVKTFLQLLLYRSNGIVNFDGNIFYSGDSTRILCTHTGYYYQMKKTLFILRDPRDVIVSFFHHVRNRGPATMHKFQVMPISDFIRDKDLGIGAMVSYYRRWWKRLKKCKELMVVRYEDLVANDLEVFNKITYFLGINSTSKIFVDTVDICRFENLKKEVAKKNGLFANHPDLADLRPVNKDPNSAKIRKGIIGGYVDELSKEDIEYIDKKIKKIPKAWRFYG